MTQTPILDVPATASGHDDDPGFLRGPVLRPLLGVLVILLVLLAGVLTLAVLDVAITPGATLLAVCGWGLLGIAGWILWARRHPAPARPPLQWRNVVGGVVTAMVLIGAVGVAQAMQPTTIERFVSLQATASGPYTDGALRVRAGDQILLGWELRGHGVDLSADPAVAVTLDSVTPADLSLGATPAPTPAGTGFTSGLAGSVAFTAPSAPGRHQVVVTVTDAADPAGGQQLVVQVVVTT